MFSFTVHVVYFFSSGHKWDCSNNNKKSLRLREPFPYETATIKETTIKLWWCYNCDVFPVMTLFPWRFRDGETYVMPEKAEKSVYFRGAAQAESKSGNTQRVRNSHWIKQATFVLPESSFWLSRGWRQCGIKKRWSLDPVLLPLKVFLLLWDSFMGADGLTTGVMAPF